MKDMKTIIDLFERSCEKFPDNPYLWEKKNGKFAATSYMEVKREVLDFAGALCHLGMNRGDRIALLSEGCNAWVYLELGMLYSGGVNVPLSIKLTDNEIVFRVKYSQARFLIVSANFLSRVRGIEGQIEEVEKIIVIHSGINEGKYISFELLQREGEIWRKTHEELLNGRIHAVTEDDLVNISYTSGTTTKPKGIMLSLRNYVTNVLQLDSLIQIPAYYRILLFLPWDHSFAHTVGLYSFMYNGASPEVSSNTPANYRFGSSGKLVKPMELKICDEEGNVLPAGQKGELWICGGNVMEGYWRNEKSTAETIVDGWLHTGDLGYLHKDGWLYVLRRFKSLLIANDGGKV